MTISLSTPRADDLAPMADSLSAWHRDRGPLQIHPGDLGWFSLRGPDRTAAALRVWSRDGRMLALGLLDDPDLLRMAVAPDAQHEDELAQHVAADITDPSRGVLGTGTVVVEARGATRLTQVLLEQGWGYDEPWTTFHHDLSSPVSADPITDAGVGIETVGPDRAEPWTAVHWSAFKGTPFGPADRDVFVERWRTMATGPFSGRGRSLMAVDGHGEAVAVATVWSAGRGRPGLIEPMGVHRSHRGRGYGVAISTAALSALQQLGSSSAIVSTESSNLGAVATYTAAGFTGTEVADLRRTG